MSDLIQAFIAFDFLRYAFFAGVLASIACGLIGPYVVVKRISFISGGIAHSVMGGVGLAFYIGVDPLWGSIVFALISAAILAWVKLFYKQNEDTVVGALWALGMAVGILAMHLTPGYQNDLFSYLFGNILLVSQDKLIILSLLDLLLFACVVLYYRQFLFLSFDEEYASLKGLPVKWLYLLLLIMVALTVVILMQIVGVILLIAMLTIPAAISAFFTKSLSKMMLISIALGFVFNSVGIAGSFLLDLPSGSCIVVVTCLTYFIGMIIKKLDLSQ
jgi:zinc transport system permease protein